MSESDIIFYCLNKRSSVRDKGKEIQHNKHIVCTYRLIKFSSEFGEELKLKA